MPRARRGCLRVHLSQLKVPTLRAICFRRIRGLSTHSGVSLLIVTDALYVLFGMMFAR